MLIHCLSSRFPSLALEPEASGEYRISAFGECPRPGRDNPDNAGRPGGECDNGLFGRIRLRTQAKRLQGKVLSLRCERPGLKPGVETNLACKDFLMEASAGIEPACKDLQSSA